MKMTSSLLRVLLSEISGYLQKFDDTETISFLIENKNYSENTMNYRVKLKKSYKKLLEIQFLSTNI